MPKKQQAITLTSDVYCSNMASLGHYELIALLHVWVFANVLLK